MVKPKKKVIKSVEPAIIAVDEPVTIKTITPKTKSLKEVVEMFPEATSTLTQRWYGETFFPQYQKALGELRKLAK